MTFPTTSILDDFTRADENPLSDGGSWSGPLFSGDIATRLVSDTATAGTSTYSESCWDAVFSGAVEAYGILSDWDNDPGVFCNASNINTGSETGYWVSVAGSTWDLYRLDGGGVGGSTIIASGTGTFSPGDGLGISVASGVVTAWQKSSGSWVSLGTATDSTYTSGKVGITFLGFGGTNTGFTSFGGGGATSAPTAPGKRGLYLSVTDLNGNPWETAADARPLPVRTGDQPQVTIPLSDSRTGQIGLSMYEAAAAVVAGNPATSVVKVLYVNPKGDSVLCLNGIVLTPESNFDAGTVTAQLHDSTIRLKRRYLGYNHYSIMLGTGEEVSDGDVDALTGGDFNGETSVYGIPLDGTGLRLMILDATHGAADWRGWPYPTSDEFSSVPPVGIRFQPGYSNDGANRQPLYGAEGVPPQGFQFTANVVNGDATLHDVVLPSGVTLSDVYEYGALFGPGIADFATVVSASSTSAGDIIVMSEPATADHSDATVTLEDAIYCQLSRGDCVNDDITDMVQAQGAFECDWIPVDAAHLGPSGATWVPGQLCELLTSNRVGTDRSQSNTGGHVPVVFVHGRGGFKLTHSPDANSLITYEVQVGPGGPGDPNDLHNKVTLESNSGVPEFGIWEDWQQATSAGTGDTPISNAVLTDRAEAVLTAYQQVPEFVTATVDTDVVGAYCFGTDFFLGDTVTVYGKKGYVTVGPLDVRITQVTITQTDHNGNCQLGLTMVPYLTADANIGSGS